MRKGKRREMVREGGMHSLGQMEREEKGKVDG